jgi:hypothetical protein
MIWLFSVLSVFGATVLSHGILGWLGFPRNSVFRYISVWVIGALFLFAWFRSQEVSDFERLASFALFAWLGELYVFLFTFVISSISAAILMEPDCARAEFADFGQKDPKKTMEKRMAGLIRLGWIRSDPEKLEPTVQGRLLIRAYRSLRWLFCHGDTAC